MLQQWELSLVSRLEWCLPSVVPSDFLEPILHALPFVQPQHLLTVCRHVHSYVALAATGELHNRTFAHKVSHPDTAQHAFFLLHACILFRNCSVS